jgi:hypothetical protein
MPALPSFINYKPGRKTRAAIKSPFSLLRGDPSASTATASPLQNLITEDVIDINDNPSRHSLDFDGGKPIDTYDNTLMGERLGQRAEIASPQVQLPDIDFSREPLTDWFSANFPQSEGSSRAVEGPKPSGSGLRNEVANMSASTGSLGLKDGMKGMEESSGVGDDDEDEDEDDESSPTSSSEDVLANLRAMDVSHL